MFDMVATTFSYGRASIVCQFLQEFFRVKESSLREIWNADTAFYFSGTALLIYTMLTTQAYVNDLALHILAPFMYFIWHLTTIVDSFTWRFGAWQHLWFIFFKSVYVCIDRTFIYYCIKVGIPRRRSCTWYSFLIQVFLLVVPVTKFLWIIQISTLNGTN